MTDFKGNNGCTRNLVHLLRKFILRKIGKENTDKCSLLSD